MYMYMHMWYCAHLGVYDRTYACMREEGREETRERRERREPCHVVHPIINLTNISRSVSFMLVFVLIQVQEIIKAAKFIEPNLGELPGALKARLSDSNKNHIMTTLGIIGTLASSMGSGCSKFTKTFIPGTINNFSDSKVLS